MISVDVKQIGVVREAGGGRHVIWVQPRYAQGLEGLEVGMRVQVLYWMHRLDHADRRTLKVHPRGDSSRPLEGVFALRSCRRPNPIGVTVAQVVAIEGTEVTVSGLDAMDGAPLIDLKVSMT